MPILTNADAMFRIAVFAAFALVMFGSPGVVHQKLTHADEPNNDQAEVSNNSPEPSPVQKLLAQDSLDGWQQTNFGGETTCEIKGGSLTITAGYPLNGITSTRQDLPVCDYEIALEASKIEGRDFFCGLTFPFEKSHATLIVGGWSGSIVGISCIDENDASEKENETRSRMKFDMDRWYKIRLRVTQTAISAWIDEKPIINFNPTDHKLSVRTETLPSKPLGICTFETTAGIRNLTLTRLSKSADEP